MEFILIHKVYNTNTIGADIYLPVGPIYNALRVKAECSAYILLDYPQVKGDISFALNFLTL